MDVRVPIVFWPNPRHREDVRVRWIQVSLAEQSLKEAPVAVRMNPTPQGHGIIDYRYFNGQLWKTLASDYWRYRTTLQELKKPALDGISWNEHPLLPAKGLVWGRWDPEDVVEDDSDEPRPELDAIEAAIRHKAKNTIIMGGEIWRCSEGPLLELRVLEPEYELHNGISDRMNYVHRSRLEGFRYDQTDEMMETARRFHGTDDLVNRREYHTLDIKIPGISHYDTLSNSYEAFAWEALWAVRRKTASELGRDAVELIVKLRSMLEERWPNHGVAYEGTNSQTDMWPHAHDRVTFPDGSALADLTTQVLQTSVHALHPYYAKLERYMSAKMAVLKPQLDLEDDLAALDGMGFSP